MMRRENAFFEHSRFSTRFESRERGKVLTVTVVNSMPEPGKKSGSSRLCQTGYRPRSRSA